MSKFNLNKISVLFEQQCEKVLHFTSIIVKRMGIVTVLELMSLFQHLRFGCSNILYLTLQ